MAPALNSYFHLALTNSIYLIYPLWICFSCCVDAKPIQTSDTQPNEGVPNLAHLGPWITAFAAILCVTISLAVCVCCKKPKGFNEFRSSTQLAELTPAQPNELTLFPPPSLSLNREDLEVRFEPLPRPLNQVSANSYRPKEVTEWIEKGQGLFSRSNIQYLREIGRGWFGQVVEAEAKELLPGQTSSRCVVKILRPESAAAQHSQFLKDVQPLLKLNHPHVLKLYACCLETSPLLVLLQHCSNGDLKQFLAGYSPSRGSNGMPPLPENVLLRMAWEAADGLSHWHQSGFCHPDVAARSYLVTGDMSVVLGDYGTHTVAYRDDFVDTGNQLLPVRWCAPECFQLSGEVIQTEAGNVWSFGVVLWEILSLGARPYGTLADDQVVQQVLQEKRTILNPPAFTYQQGQTIYQLMLQCWEVDAPLRPKAEAVVSRLAAACAGASRDVESDLEKAFDSRWNAAKPSRVSPLPHLDEEESSSGSLNNLHGSLDNLENRGSKEVLSPEKESESGYSAKVSAALRSLDEALAAAEATDSNEDDEVQDEEEESLPEPQFQLGDVTRAEEQNAEMDYSDSSGDLFSSRSDWQDKVTRGELSAMIKEKSRSVQDFMVLTHVEPMSDVEFLSTRDRNGSLGSEQPPQPMPPPITISVTSPSFTTRSPMMESDAPLLDNTDANSKGELNAGSPPTRNRNRLTSTPREDTDFDAMESSFRSSLRVKPADYGPFSPESLDATQFTGEALKSDHRDHHVSDVFENEPSAPIVHSDGASPKGVVIGPSEDLGLSIFQSVTSAHSGNEGVSKNTNNDSDEPVRLSVNVEAWNNFLEQAYPHQHSPNREEEFNNEIPILLKDSGIARPSLGSGHVLGSTFGTDDTANREWMDDLSLVARMWNEELAAALALDASLLANPAQEELDASLTVTDPQLDASATSADLSASSSVSPLKSYFSYDKIDDDIRQEEKADKIEEDEEENVGFASTMRRNDLSTIKEERESLCGTPRETVETGRSLLNQLQAKSRMQRHIHLSDSSDSDSEGDRDDDDDDVLVVDLESKKAVMLEGQSPKLRAAMASQNYDGIFGTCGENDAVRRNGQPTMKTSDNGDEEEGEYANDFENDDDEEEEEDDDDDDDDDDDEDEGVADSNFVWQACYPATKLNQSFSMEVIEEECEDEGEDDSAGPFVPSTWKPEATPTRPIIRSPEKGEVSPKKNVSFSQPKRKEVYEYPGEVEEPPPARRQWSVPVTTAMPEKGPAFADMADWDFSVDDGELNNEAPRDLEENHPKIAPRSSNPLTNSILYRLSGIDDEEGDAPPQSDSEKYFQGEWQSQFSHSEFQPDQFFNNWMESSVDRADVNKESNGVESVIGTLRHTLESGRLRLDLSQSRSLEDEEDA